jgi:hypothetical protein
LLALRHLHSLNMAVAGMAVVVAVAAVSMVAAVEVGISAAVVGTPILAAADILRDVQADRRHAHFQGRASLEIAVSGILARGPTG